MLGSIGSQFWHGGEPLELLVVKDRLHTEEQRAKLPTDLREKCIPLEEFFGEGVSQPNACVK